MLRRVFVATLAAVLLFPPAAAARQESPSALAPAAPAPQPKQDPPVELKRLRLEIPPELLKSSSCTADDWQRIHRARRRAYVSFYIVGPLVSLGLSAAMYRADRQFRPGDLGKSIGVGSVVGSTFGATFLTSANRRQLDCTFPR